MSEHNGFNNPPVEPRDSNLASEGGLRAPPGLGFFGKLWWWFHFLILVKIARLRFIAALFAIGAVIVYWDTLKAYYDRYTRPPAAVASAESGYEYFCPMHPTVIRDNGKEKCPLCFMPLSKRKKGEGEAEPLPPGTVSRVQLSPYRIVLAGVQASEVERRALRREVTTVGTVEFDERRLSRITARAGGRSRIDKLYINVTGQAVRPGDPLALLYNPELATTAQNLVDALQAGNTDLQNLAVSRLRLWGIADEEIDGVRRTGRPVTHITVRSPMGGQVIRKYQVEGEYVDEGARLYDLADLSSVWIEAQVYEGHVSLLRPGMEVSATTTAYPDEKFLGRLALIQPHLDAVTRTLRVRFDIDNASGRLRPGMYAAVKLEVPVGDLAGVDAARDRREAEAEAATAALAVGSLLAPTGPLGPTGLEAALVSAVERAYEGQGLTLAIPETAVIDTGSRKVVYRESAPGVYDGVEVRLGPLCDLYYPVLRGLQPGDRVVTSGSFLVDAETRLNPAAGSIYLAGSGSRGGPSAVTARPSMSGDEEAQVKAALARLSPADRKLAEEQGTCPVLGGKLGAMGVPVKLSLKGQTVFLCCKGCEEKARKSPDEILAKVEQFKNGQRTPPAGKPGAGASPEDEAEIVEALGKLGPEDRKLAAAQRYCPVQQERLGTMGPPVKVTLQGRTVFVCCAGCRAQAAENPAATLSQVDRFLKGGRPAR